MGHRLTRRQAARIAALAAWHFNRDRKLEDSRRGGETTLRRYGRGHFVKLLAMQLARRSDGGAA